MMNSMIPYFIKANIALVVLYSLYLILFNRTTYHVLNRIFLLSCILLSVILPLTEYNFYTTPETNFAIADWIDNIPFYESDWQGQNDQVSSAKLLSPSILLVLLYFSGVLILLWRFLSQLRMMRNLYRKALPTQDSNVFLTTQGMLPFTFFRRTFLPDKVNRNGINSYILQHEKVHANQLHTLDLIIAELFCIVFWYNPFVFLLKRSLKTVHEYLADAYVLSDTKSKTDYLNLLVEGVAPVKVSSISSSFYWLTIKKRINMITKNKSPKFIRLAYLLIIPAAALLIQSFSNISVGNSPALKEELTEKKNFVPQIKPIAEADIVKISSEYGMRIHPITKIEKMHIGVDFVAKTGTPVVVTADGIVVKVEYKEEKKGYGRMVLVQHGSHYATRYTQLSAFNVREGDELKMGDVVGHVGSSGFSTGPHLHYEVIKDGEHVNPALYFD